VIPSSILFVASDAIEIALQNCRVDVDSCPEFDRWLQLKKAGVALDFRRIQRVGFDLPSLNDHFVNLSEFEKESIITESDQVSSQIYHRIEDQVLVVVKSIAHLECVEKSRIENAIENLINLRHPCIAAPIGFVVSIESGSLQELKIVRLYSEGWSLAEVIFGNPEWWTSTVKAKIVAGIVLGLWFAHSFGLLHGCLTTNNILFDLDDGLQIVDFQPMLLDVAEEGTQIGGFSGEGWSPETDVHAFASILFEIVVGRSADGETCAPSDIPAFVSRIIETVLWSTSETRLSFHDIFEILKQNNFQIEDDVDSGEVSAFVSWIESAERHNK
jgi:hypothetical protein